MISRLSINFDIKSEGKTINYNSGSLFQGILMEFIDREYGEELHLNKLKPYTQHIEKIGDSYLWIITTLTERSKKEIIDNIIKKIPKELIIKRSDIKIEIIDINVIEINFDKLIQDNYIDSETNNYITLRFLTPTAFKSNSKYIIYPDIELIFKSLINKYNSFADDYEINDEETFDYIVSNTEIIDYNLHSTCFFMEGIKIPSFMGKIKLKLKGTVTSKNLINLLLDFGQYSGIGIKTAMGMGCIKIENSKGRLKKNE